MQITELIIVGLFLGTIITISVIVLGRTLIEYGRNLGRRKRS